MRYGIGSSLEHTKQNKHELVKKKTRAAKVESDNNNKENNFECMNESNIVSE